jgi:hypothetical protein
MRTRQAFVLAAFSLMAGGALAVREEAVNADRVLQETGSRGMRGLSSQEETLREAARRAEAEKKVERLRSLPPERVQDWISGKLTETDLERLSAAPREAATDTAVPVPRGRLNRLLLVSGSVLVLALLYALQRRREGAAARK